MNKPERKLIEDLKSRILKLENKLESQTSISRRRKYPICCEDSSLYPRMIYTRSYALKSVVELILRKLHLDIEYIPEQEERLSLVSTKKSVKPKKQGVKK